jgi:hypothetical protein
MKATADRVERTALLSGDSRKDGDLFIGLLQGLIRKTNYVTFMKPSPCRTKFFTKFPLKATFYENKMKFKKLVS